MSLPSEITPPIPQPLPVPSRNRPVPWGAVLLLIFCGILLLLSGLTLLFYLFQGISAFMTGRSEYATTFLIQAGGSLARMLLFLPACYYSLVRILEREPRHLRLAVIPSWALVLAWLASLGLGYLLLGGQRFAPLLLPFLSVLGVVLPIWLILRLALHGLRYASDLRRWGTLAVGSTLGPFLSSLLEVITIVGLVLAAVVYVMVDPARLQSLQNLAQRMQHATTEQEILNLLLPVMSKPGTVFLVILTICVLTPLIEEALKPIGVWLGLGRLTRPVQGFALGALCGAGFALFENFSAAATGGPDWALVTALRVGTATMHIANSALMGWALVCAWNQRAYLRLGLVYAGVVLVHGTWNFLAISYGVSRLPSVLEGIAPELNIKAPFALPGLGLLVVIMLGLLIYMNRRLQEPPPYSGLAQDSSGTPGGDLRV